MEDNKNQPISPEEYKRVTEALYKQNLELANLYKKVDHLNSELERANEQQVVLIHLITHQIKSFFTKSRNIFSMLLDGDFGQLPGQIHGVIESGLASDTEGISMVQDILNASNIKKGKLEYKMAPFDFRNVVTKIIENYKKGAEERGLSLSLSIAPGDYITNGDEGQLDHVIKNLVDNSIKYTERGSVAASLSRQDNKIVFSLKDSGVGLSEDDKTKLFTEGGRGKESQKLDVNSTGYGLYIAKGIVEAHEGRIWADSEGRNMGTTFYIELPVKT